MRWSKWKGFAALTLASSVGLAWSQTPTTTRPTAVAAERIMTVHENGQTLRCRVVQSWRTQSGSQAHQVQVVDTREMLTIVQEGEATAVAGSQMREQRLRIFHWGQRATPPIGSPTPPVTVEPALNGVATVAGQDASAIPNVAMAPVPITNTIGNPIAAVTPSTGNTVTTPIGTVISTSGTNCATPCDPCPPACAPTIIGGSHDRIISWEDNCRPGQVITGGGVSRSVVTGSTSYGQPVIVSEKVISVQEGSPAQSTTKGGLFSRMRGGNTTTNTSGQMVTVYDSRGNPIMVRDTELSPLPGNSSVVTSVPIGGAPTTTIPNNSGPTNATLTNTLPKGATTTLPKATTPTDKTPRSFSEKMFNKSADPKSLDVKKEDKGPPTQLPAPVPSTKKDDGKTDKTQSISTNKSAAVDEKRPFSTATLPAPSAPKVAAPISGGAKTDADDSFRPGAAKTSAPENKAMWGKSGDNKIEQPGQATIERERIISKKTDILMSPDRINPDNEKVNPKTTAAMAGFGAEQFGSVPTPLGAGSVLAAANGNRGPVQYIPVPVATVPEPIRPPTPPEPQVPQAPNPAQYLNAFTTPPNPNGQQPSYLPPPSVQQQQAMMQQAMYHQAMMQRMQQQQNTTNLIPVQYGVPMQATYPANYTGPQPPRNPYQQAAPPRQQYPVQPAGGFVPQPPANNPVQQAANNSPAPAAQQTAVQQPAVDESATLSQLIGVLQQSPYPAQREWAATNLATFDWRVYPHLTQVLVQAARQDQVASVRAAAVYSLSRLNVHSEAVLGTLGALRNDADPRVRQEVEQAYGRMGLNNQQR